MIFFQLLRYSIGASEDFSANLSAKDWESVYRMSVVHSLSDVLFYGVQKAGLKPSFDVLMKWVADDELIRSRNKKTNSKGGQENEKSFKLDR